MSGDHISIGVLVAWSVLYVQSVYVEKSKPSGNFTISVQKL